MNSNLPLLYGGNYIEQRNPYLSGFPIITQEDPATAIAKKAPLNALRFLEKESQRRYKESILSIGQNVASTYLERLDSNAVREISKVKVRPNKRMGLFGIFGDRGLEIKIIRR